MAISSFALPMRLMAPKRAQAIRALYRFCREVDDIADGHDAPEEKMRALELQRLQLRNGTHLAVDLEQAIEKYALPLEPFERIIDAMQMDVRGEMRWPAAPALALYCDGAAGAVGLLAIRIFGCSARSEPFALALGQVLQRINILRDVREDAARGRVYLPREWLAGDLALLPPAAILKSPALVHAQLCQLNEEILGRIQQLYAPKEDRRALRPAFAMLGIYQQWLALMQKDDFAHKQHYRLSAMRKCLGCVRGVLAPEA